MNDVSTVNETRTSEAELVFYTTKQIAKALGCSIPTARQLFYRADFPALKIGKNYKVEKNAFEKWCSERRM